MRRIAFAVLLILASAMTGLAQSQISSGELRGTAEDLHGGVLAGTMIRLRNIETGLQRLSVADTLGIWHFFIVPSGAYEIRVERPGFVTLTRSPVQVTVGETVDVDLRLEPAGAAEEVLVQANSPVLEIGKTQQSDTITVERIDNLPNNQRDVLDFALLTPGVTDARGLGTFSPSQSPATNLSFLGQSGNSNSVTIDGTEIIRGTVASGSSILNQDAVQEFQVDRSNFSAESGRATGGTLHIVSRSGANDWHGNVFSFFRNQSLDARNPFAFGANGSDPSFSRLQAGFTLGGPIRRDRTFYFLSYEGMRKRETQSVSFMDNTSAFQPSASQDALIHALTMSSSPTFTALGSQLRGTLTTSAASYPDTLRLLQANSTFPSRSNNNIASLRLDHSWKSTNQLFGRLTFTDTDTTGELSGSQQASSRATNYSIRDYAIAAGDSAFFGSSRANEFRIQIASRRDDRMPTDTRGPEITINGFAGLGRDYLLPSLRDEKRVQVLDNFTISKGRHVLKFGGDANVIPIDRTMESSFGGRFIFGEVVPLSAIIDSAGGAGAAASLAAAFPAFASNIAAPISSLQATNFGSPLLYQQGFGDPKSRQTMKLFSGYAEDRFRVRENLSFDFGVRYDVELQPAPVHQDRNNFAPRFGFTFSPASKTLIRGGYGIYYAPLYEALGSFGPELNTQQISQVFAPLSRSLTPYAGTPVTASQVWMSIRANGILGNRAIAAGDIAPLGLIPGTPAVLVSTDPGIVNPYSQQFSLGVEREVFGLNVSAMYLGNRGLKLIRSRNINLQQVGTNAYGPVLGPINPDILQNNKVESSGSSTYHGMTLNVTKRFSRYYQFQAAYTLSKAIDDTDFSADFQAANPLDLRSERSLSTFDQRQRLVVSGVFQSPLVRGMRMGSVLSGVTLSPILAISSGHPFDLLLGFDANGDTRTNTDRPAFVGRNTGEGPGYASLDMRVAKEIHWIGSRMQVEGIEVVFETFNLLNRVNFSGINNIVGSMGITNDRVQGDRTLSSSTALGFTSASDARQIQLGLKFKF